MRLKTKRMFNPSIVSFLVVFVSFLVLIIRIRSPKKAHRTWSDFLCSMQIVFTWNTLSYPRLLQGVKRNWNPIIVYCRICHNVILFLVVLLVLVILDCYLHSVNLDVFRCNRCCTIAVDACCYCRLCTLNGRRVSIKKLEYVSNASTKRHYHPF